MWGRVAALVDRIETVDVLAVALVAFVFVTLEVDPATIVVTLVAGIAASAVRRGLEATDVDGAVAGLFFAGVVVAAGLAMVLSAGGWTGWLFVAVGCWLGLDSAYSWRHDNEHGKRATETDAHGERDEQEDLTRDEYSLAFTHSWWVLEELREADRPLSRAELQSRTSLADADLDRVLEIHGESGVVDRVGTGYVVDERELGTAAMGRSLVRRILRPFRVFRPSG